MIEAPGVDFKDALKDAQHMGVVLRDHVRGVVGIPRPQEGCVFWPGSRLNCCNMCAHGEANMEPSPQQLQIVALAVLFVKNRKLFILSVNITWFASPH
eukprot:16446198-Heterocapsa_arctica.AAC.2